MKPVNMPLLLLYATSDHHISYYRSVSATIEHTPWLDYEIILGITVRWFPNWFFRSSIAIDFLIFIYYFALPRTSCSERNQTKFTTCRIHSFISIGFAYRTNVKFIKKNISEINRKYHNRTYGNACDLIK